MHVMICGRCGGVVGGRPGCAHFAKHQESYEEVEVLTIGEARQATQREKIKYRKRAQAAEDQLFTYTRLLTGQTFPA